MPAVFRFGNEISQNGRSSVLYPLFSGLAAGVNDDVVGNIEIRICQFWNRF